MIIDMSFEYNKIDISYINKDGNKALMSLAPPPGGYTNWVVDANGPGTPGYIDITGLPVKKVPAKTFNRYDLLEFLFSLPQETQEELFAYRKANLICVDIETDIADRFPDPAKADQEILLITAIDSQFRIITYTTKPANAVRDKIISIVTNHAGHLLPPGKTIDPIILEYSNETDMLTQFLQNIVANAAIIAFWNGIGGENSFDWPYITNRCGVLGVNFSIASCTGKISTYDGTPKHTLITDYMLLTDEYAGTIKNKESLSLDYMSWRVLNIGKLPKIASLKQMAKDLNLVAEFAAYNIVDVLNMQLMDMKLSLLNVVYAFASLNKLPMTKAESQVAQTESMICLEALEHLDKENPTVRHVAGYREIRPTFPIMLPKAIPMLFEGKPITVPEGTVLHFHANGYAGYAFKPKPTSKPKIVPVEIGFVEDQALPGAVDLWVKHNIEHRYKRPIFGIGGGYVKDPDPARPLKRWLACIDFSGQYPACHRSFNISVENIIGHISEFSPEQQKFYHESPKYCVSFMNYVYDVSKPGIYKRCQERLRGKRDEHKNTMLLHLNIIQPFIENELFNRGLWHMKPVLPSESDIKKLNKGSLHFAVVDDIELNGDLSHHETWFIWHCFHTNLTMGFYHANMQTGYKLESNSLYGATTNAYNNFGDSRVAEDTTAGGRNTIQCSDLLINNYIAFEWHKDEALHKLLYTRLGAENFKTVPNFGKLEQLEYRDRIAYTDTDSLYVEFSDLCESIGYIGDYTEFFVMLYEDYLGDIVNARLADMINGRGGQSMIKFDLEMICPHAIFTKKKKYMLTISYQDGRRFSDPLENMVVKGMDIKQNALSPKAKSVVKKCTKLLLTDQMTTKEHYYQFIKEAWEDFKTWSLEDIGKRMSIAKDNYEKNILSDNVKDGVTWASRTLPQYRGAAFFNWQLDHYGLLNEVEPLHDGALVCYDDTFGNPFCFRLQEEPPFEYPPANLLVQFDKIIVKPINRIAYAFDVIADIRDIFGNEFDSDARSEDMDDDE